MTLVDFVLQGVSLLVNILLTKALGEEVLGIVSLVMSFYGTFIVLSNGNAFLCANRFISEERGKANGNPNTIMVYSLAWGSILATVSTILITIFSDRLCLHLFNDTEYSKGVKILASTLVLTAMISTIRGYFYAHRKVTVPLVAGGIEFAIKNAVIIVSIYYFKMNIIVLIALSVLISQVVTLVYLGVSLTLTIRKNSNVTNSSFKDYVKASIPIALNSGIPLILSSCNDALLPITLKECGTSSEQSLALYGMFEAIVIPILFFPSTILCSLSCIMVTEVARSHTANDWGRVNRISRKVIRLTLGFSLIVVVALLIFGDDIALLIGSTVFSGKIVKILSPVVPLIYLEITLESILKGLGKHGFSSVNYIAEYLVRISTLLICVPLFHFYGIVVSYYVSNVVGNTSRILYVAKCLNLKDNTKRSKSNTITTRCTPKRV